MRPAVAATEEPTINNVAHPRPATPADADGDRHAPDGAGVDWDSVDLVVFDVDGTLYDQRRLRLLMLRELLRDAWSSRSLATLRTLRSFREIREALGDEPVDDFLQQQYARTAAQHGSTADAVQALVTDWMEQRPLACIGRCVYRHVPALFESLHTRGKQVAVFSDYPARDKIQALGLRAYPIICATDAEVARLKPDPRGLLAILAHCDVNPRRALMIGDRFDRDAAAARRAGVRALIRSRQPHADFATFRAYDDPVFAPLLGSAGRAAAAA